MNRQFQPDSYLACSRQSAASSWYPFTYCRKGIPVPGFSPLKSFILYLFFLLLPVSLSAQLDAGPNDTINPGIPVTLTATYGLTGEGVTTTEDGVEGPFPIGFTFSFFGNIYSQFYIGANGWISFSPNENAKGVDDIFAIPNSSDFYAKNAIFGPLQDLNPIQAGSPYIFYRTIGQDPHRQLVVMWCRTPFYDCKDSLMTFQIVLNEGFNTIENHLMNKPSCPNWHGNAATQGVQNETGFIGYAVPGRNATSWTARLEGWQYIPTSVDSFQISPIPYNLHPITPGEKISFRWYQGSEQIASQQSVVVTPSITTTYFVHAILCDGEEFTDSVTVYVVPYIPNAFTPNGDGLNDLFRLVGLPPENITEFHFQVFNRWGEVVFSSREIETGWDGTLNGEDCPVGVYVWAVYYKENGRHTVTNKGTLSLIR